MHLNLPRIVDDFVDSRVFKDLDFPCVVGNGPDLGVDRGAEFPSIVVNLTDVTPRHGVPHVVLVRRHFGEIKFGRQLLGVSRE